MLIFKIYHHEKKVSLLVEKLIKEMEFRNYSPQSIRCYSEQLVRLETHLNLPLDTISVRQFKDYLHGRIIKEMISVPLVNQTISAFKILQVDVLGREWEAIKIRRPRKEKKLPVILSLSEVEKLIAVTENIKHRAIIALAYSAGLRLHETLSIKPSAIDSERMLVHVIKNLAVKAGVNKKISFHTLRHCFATHLLEQGVNIRMIQEFTGHNSIKTTSGYIHLANLQASGVRSPLDSMDI